MSDRLAEIEARLEAATPGPWEHKPPPQDGTVHSVIHNPATVYPKRICTMEDTGYSEAASWAQRSNDAEFIAHAPRDLRDLLAVAKAARDLNDAIRHRRTGVAADVPSMERGLDAALANLEGGA